MAGARCAYILGIACLYLQGWVETHNGHLELEYIDTSDPKVTRHAIAGKGSTAAIYAQQT